MYANADFRRRLMLADGGVYDNMGLETVWGRYTTVLVSDGGKPFELDAKPSGSFAQLARVADIGLNQALALRKRMLVDAFQQKQCRGTYWGIGTQIADYGLGEGALNVAPAKTAEMAAIRTRLNSFSDKEQEELMNWGYAVCDAAMRTHVPELCANGSTQPPWLFPDRPMH